jgi:hypothetical protein
MPVRTGTAATGVVYCDRNSVLLSDGSVLRIADAIDRLEWQPMLCPTMPHAYVVSTWRSLDRSAFDAILEMIRHSPDTVGAYWRGYQRPTRYWHGPNGFRYWTTPGYEAGFILLNRTNDVDDTRPVKLGGEPITGWVGCPWEPQGDGPRIYERVEGLDGWWPTAAALADGYQLCRSCKRRAADRSSSPAPTTAAQPVELNPIAAASARTIPCPVALPSGSPLPQETG